MSELSDMNKGLTIYFFEQVFNHQNYDIVASLISPDYKYNGVPGTAAETVGFAKELQQKYPGLHFVIQAILAEDDKVALRWRMNVADPASGQKGYVTGTNIIVYADAKAISNDQAGGDQFVALPAAAAANG